MMEAPAIVRPTLLVTVQFDADELICPPAHLPNLAISFSLDCALPEGPPGAGGGHSAAAAAEAPTRARRAYNRLSDFFF
jgi:hypothetical protein